MDSLGDFNSSPAQRVLPHLNVLADLVHPNDESESCPQTDDFSSMRPLPTDILSRIWDEYEQDDSLFRTYPITSSPTIIPQGNNPSSFFHSEKRANHTETGSNVSSESSSSLDARSTCHSEKNALTSPAASSSFSISDVCTSTEANCESQSLSSRKRRHIGEQARDCSASDSAKKKRKAARPSKFCHVCVRSCDQVHMVPCVNVAVGNCRKNICKRCFEKHGIAHEWVTATQNPGLIHKIHTRAIERIPDDAWACLHCRKMCPSNAQCAIYQRTNRRRHESLQQRRKMRLERERKIEQQMIEARKQEETRQRKIVDSFIYPTDFSPIPLAVPLPPDMVPEGDQYFRNGLSHTIEDIFSPLLAESEASS